jgi:hypothetical protein
MMWYQSIGLKIFLLLMCASLTAIVGLVLHTTTSLLRGLVFL